MKKFSITVLIIIILSFAFAQSVYSANSSLSFELSDESSLPNRLVTFEMRAKLAESLGAATFEFTYDSSMLEYRSLKASNDSAKVTANDIGGKVKLVYLNVGESSNTSDNIFSITFKALREGNASVDFKVSQCADKNAEWLDIESCKSGFVNISKTASNSNNDKSAADSKDKTESSGSSSKRKSKSTTEPNTDKPTTIDDLGVLNPINKKNFTYLFAGLGLGISLVCISVLIYVIISRNKNKSNKENGAEK